MTRSASALRQWWAQSPRRWSGADLWHLVWLASVFYQPLFDPSSGALQYVAGIAMIVVFVPFYLAVELRPGPLRPWSPAIATAISLLAVPLNAGASIVLVYAAGFAGGHLPRRSSVRWLIGLTAILCVITLVSPIPLPYRFLVFGPSLALVWIIGLVTMDAAERDRLTRFRNAQVEHIATLSERERIARDLHDLLGQTLTGIVVRSQLAQRIARADADAGIAEMAQVERAARDALSEVRATVSGWRQVVLDDEIPVAREALAAAGVELTVTRDPDLLLTPSAETALGLALREAVTNVIRHAHARRCTIALRRADERVVLEIADDGVGGGGREGSGLTGMRERIAALGGEVQCMASGGTAITVAVPAAVAT